MARKSALEQMETKARKLAARIARSIGFKGHIFTDNKRIFRDPRMKKLSGKIWNSAESRRARARENRQGD